MCVFMSLCVCLCVCVLLCVSLICSSNIDRRGMRSFLQGMLLPFCTNGSIVSLPAAGSCWERLRGGSSGSRWMADTFCEGFIPGAVTGSLVVDCGFDLKPKLRRTLGILNFSHSSHVSSQTPQSLASNISPLMNTKEK